MVEQVSSLRTGVKYKDTPIGKIPVDWEIRKLGELCAGKPEYGANTPAIDKIQNLPRYIMITDITDEGRLLESTWKSVEKEFARPYILQNGDLLFARRGATVGKTYLYKAENGESAYSGYLIRFKTKPKLLLPEFLFHFTHSSYYYNWVKGMLREGAQPNINAKKYSDMLIPKPPIEEQKKIAEVITTVDEAIKKTTEIIEKTKELKKGLMQRLLTRGIGHKKFKKTEIGEIPLDWEAVRLNDLAVPKKYAFVDGPFDSNLKSIHYVDKGIPVIQSQYVISGKFGSNETFFVSQEKAKELARSKVLPGDIVIAKIGVNYGASATIPENYPEAVLSGNTMKITPDQKKTVTKFLQYVLHYSRETKTFDKIVSTTAQPAITLKGARNLKIPLPQISEQNKIADVLSSIDDELEKESNHRDQLNLLKKGLMQVLLTGRLRVTV